MANVKISALPQYSATVNPDIYFVNNNSGETQTTKIKLSQFNGLTKGTGPNSIMSSNSLSSFPMSATNESAIAIGNGAEATSDYSIAIGYKAYNVNRDFNRPEYIAIGKEAQAVQYGIAIGSLSLSQGQDAICIGTNTKSYDNESLVMVKDARNDRPQGISLGFQSYNNGRRGITIGASATVNGENGISIGYDSQVDGFGSVAIGSLATNTGAYSTTIGGSGHTNAGVNNTILGGRENTTSTQENAVMVGCSGRTATTNMATFVENLVIFNYANLDFPNDSDAAAAGVVLGQVYHNNGALRIRHT